MPFSRQEVLARLMKRRFAGKDAEFFKEVSCLADSTNSTTEFSETDVDLSEAAAAVSDETEIEV